MRVLLDECLPRRLSQQDLSAIELAVVVLVARSNTLPDLRGLIPELLDQLPNVMPGRATIISSQA